MHKHFIGIQKNIKIAQKFPDKKFKYKNSFEFSSYFSPSFLLFHFFKFVFLLLFQSINFNSFLFKLMCYMFNLFFQAICLDRVSISSCLFETGVDWSTFSEIDMYSNISLHIFCKYSNHQQLHTNNCNLRFPISWQQWNLWLVFKSIFSFCRLHPSGQANQSGMRKRIPAEGRNHPKLQSRNDKKEFD